MPIDPQLLQRMREESGLRLDREGRFWHRGDLLEHARTLAALHRGLHRAADGRWATRIGTEWGYVEVEDTGRFVRRIEEDPAAPGQLRAQLATGDWVQADPATLATGADDALYLRVPPDGERARLTRTAQLSLAERINEDAPGEFTLRLGGKSWPIGVDRGPEPIRLP